MCSIGDGDIEDQENNKFMVARNTIKISNKLCNKCKTKEPSIVSQHKHAYCVCCFLANTTHKFRSYLGSLKLSYIDENILIVHKCGHPTTALLHLLRTGLDVSEYKKIKIRPIVLFVEDLHQLTMLERSNLMKQVSQEVNSFNFDLYFTSLSKYILSHEVQLTSASTDVELHENDEQAINEALNKCPNKTVKEEFKNVYRKKLVIEVGKQLNCKWVLTTQVSLNNAADLLTNMCLGRGVNGITSSRINVSSKETSDNMVFLAPFIDMDIKELALYNYFHELTPVIYHLKTGNPNETIQALLKKFVIDLQVNYPSTVNTIVKTGEKLTVNQSTNSDLCSFCRGPKESGCLQLSSKESKDFSHWISTGNASRKYDEQNLSSNNRDISSNYCYRCSEIINFIL